ncbi:MAG: hypothetical protein KR126chlam6_00121 [Candidatus Anoxychlamydiales bacterium]|nr:hypothetical protein [Candidatus Anoxychlamydiales bacterium]
MASPTSPAGPRSGSGTHTSVVSSADATENRVNNIALEKIAEYSAVGTAVGLFVGGPIGMPVGCAAGAAAGAAVGAWKWLNS